MEIIKKYKKNKTKIAMAFLSFAMIPFFSGCGSSSSAGYLVPLEIWGPLDDSLVYSDIIDQYKKINPYAGEIKYKKFSQDTYRDELIDALASGQGPDIFMINNSWVPYFENKTYPAPAHLVSEIDIQNNFPDVVSSDFVSNKNVYAVPLSIDSLQMYYNKDMFNAAGISYPPRTWDEFKEDVRILISIDNSGNIVRSGAAIGTTKNVNRFSDIFSMLLLQNGVKMPMKNGDAINFDEGIVGLDGKVIKAGEKSLEMYTQFARINNPDGTTNPFYTWNSQQDNSIEAFASGSTAMMLNYSWQNDGIKSKNSKLNYSIAPVPQVDPSKPITVANYWGYAVSLNKIPINTSRNSVQKTAVVSNDVRAHEAWQFLKFLTLKNSGKVTLYNANTKNKKDFAINFDPANNYLEKTKKPAARRDIIELQKTDVLLGTFATGNLIAKNWYKKDANAVESVFLEMINSVNSGKALDESLSIAKNRINQMPIN